MLPASHPVRQIAYFVGDVRVAALAHHRQFGSGPFFVAEQFTGTSGQYVPIAETVRSFRELIDGEHDDLPESAFLLKGSIDDVVAAVKKA